MNNFIFQNKTKIVFGKDMEKRTGKETAKFAKKVLLHYGGGSIKKFGVYQKVVDSLKESGVEFIELGGVKPNPRLSLVREGIEICKTQGIEGILAVGGGSVIDSAKAIAVGAVTDQDIWDFYENGARAKEVLPLGVVLTIPAAGSESSNGSVITNEEKQQKFPFGSELIRPVFAILNPEFTYTLPPYQSACGAVDMLAHIQARYFTNVMDMDFSDRMCEGAMRYIIHNAPRVVEHPEDYVARSEIMWA